MPSPCALTAVLSLRAEAQPRGVLPGRPEAVPDRRRPARDDEARRACHRARDRQASRVQLRHAEPLQRHARLPGGDRRRVARLVARRRSRPARATGPGTRPSSSSGTRTTARRPTWCRCSSSPPGRSREPAARPGSRTIRSCARRRSCLGLRTHLGGAASAPSMRSAFGL